MAKMVNLLHKQNAQILASLHQMNKPTLAIARDGSNQMSQRMNYTKAEVSLALTQSTATPKSLHNIHNPYNNKWPPTHTKKHTNTKQHNTLQ